MISFRVISQSLFSTCLQNLRHLSLCLWGAIVYLPQTCPSSNIPHLSKCHPIAPAGNVGLDAWPLLQLSYSVPISVPCRMYMMLSCSVLLHLPSHCLWKQLPNFSPHVQSGSSLPLSTSQPEWILPNADLSVSLHRLKCLRGFPVSLEKKHSLLHDPALSTLFLPTCLPTSYYPPLTVPLLHWASLSSFITKAPSWPCAVLLFVFLISIGV